MERDPLYREVPDSFDARVPVPEPATKPTPRSHVYRIYLLIWFGILTSVLMGIVPKFSAVFTAVGVAMPGPTETLMAVSRIAVDYPCLWISGGLMLIWVIGGWVRKFPASLMEPLIISGLLIMVAWTLWALFAPLITVCDGVGRKT